MHHAIHEARSSAVRRCLTLLGPAAAKGAFIMQVVDIGLSEIDAFSVQYARAFKPRGFRSMFDHSSNWRLAV